MKTHLQVLLAGNPNSGKSSIFNALTGSRQRVGNYPGVTVEQRVGEMQLGDTTVQVTDLPGTYSLTSYSPEERIAQDALLDAHDSVVVVVVDSTTLKRSLVLLTQIMQTGARPLLCLNMADEARASGQRINLALLESMLGFPVVETVAHRGAGIGALREAIVRTAAAPAAKSRLKLGDRMDSALAAIRDALQETSIGAATPWVANRLLVDDWAMVERVRRLGSRGQAAIDCATRERARIEADTKLDIDLFVAESHYGFVNGLLREVVVREPRANAREVSDAIDRVLANRVLGVPIFLAIMYGIFWLTFSVGEIPMGWIESGFAALGSFVSDHWPQGSLTVLRSLIVDGIIAGVGGVLVFLPNIVLLFVALALLEDTGYMARAAFLADGIMHRLGLHGRSFIPMMTGFGCSIPGIMATRTLENERDRLTTMLVLPLMSCGARLPIWMLLIPAFFAPHLRAPALMLIYLVGIVLAFLLAMLLRRTVLRGEEAPFVMELPPYRMPTLRSVIRKMTDRSALYVRKAGTVILAISIVLWFMATFPTPSHYAIDDAIAAGTVRVQSADEPADALSEDVLTPSQVEQRRQSEAMAASMAGRLGKWLEPVLAPLGFDWKLGSAMVGAFAAKEVFVAQMGIVYSLGETGESSESLQTVLRREYSPLVGISLMLFLLIATPCVATVAIMRRESGGWKWALAQFGGLTAIAYVICLVVYQTGRLFT